MKRWTVLLAAVAFLFSLAPTQAEAQVTFGPQVVLFDFEDVGVGARADFELTDAFGIEDGFFEGIFATVNGNYVFQDSDVTTLLFNGNVAVPFDTDTQVAPYAGAGINYLRHSFDGFSTSNSGLNLLGGIFFDLGEIPAFAELQYSTTVTGYLSLSAGVLFGG